MTRKKRRAMSKADKGDLRSADALIEQILAGLPKLQAAREENNGETDGAPGEIARNAVEKFRKGVRERATQSDVDTD